MNGAVSPFRDQTKNGDTRTRGLDSEQTKLLLKDSISPIPLHKSLVLLDEIDRHGDPDMRRYGRLALAKALISHASNLKFGPEVGLGRIKHDAPVIEHWLEAIKTIVNDIELCAKLPPRPIRGDQRRRPASSPSFRSKHSRCSDHVPSLSERKRLHSHHAVRIRHSRFDTRST